MSNEQYKLTYFGIRGRVEFIRYMFHYAGVQFEDNRLDLQAWQAAKDTFPQKQLPVLEITKDGKTTIMTQSLAIGRLLANKYNLNGANLQEGALCDEIIDTAKDLTTPISTAYYDPDPERKAKAFEMVRSQVMPVKLGFLEKRLQENGGKYLVGNQWTWADFLVSCGLRLVRDYAPSIATDIDANYPGLAALEKAVEEIPKIAAYIAVRPKTDR